MAPIFLGRRWRCGLLNAQPLADTYENQCKLTQGVTRPLARLLVCVRQISLENEIARPALRSVHLDMVIPAYAFGEAPNFFHTPQEVEPA